MYSNISETFVHRNQIVYLSSNLAYTNFSAQSLTSTMSLIYDSDDNHNTGSIANRKQASLQSNPKPPDSSEDSESNSDEADNHNNNTEAAEEKQAKEDAKRNAKRARHDAYTLHEADRRENSSSPDPSPIQSELSDENEEEEDDDEELLKRMKPPKKRLTHRHSVTDGH